MKTFKFNATGPKTIQELPGVKSALKQKAEAMKVEAVRLSPRNTGAYSRAWKVVYVADSNAYRLVNTDWKAWFIEKGVGAHSGHPGNPALNIATRSIGAARK